MNTKIKNPEKQWIKDLPNKLTLFRVAVIPVLLVLFPLGYEPLRIFCVFLFALASISDFFDGYIARKYDAVTKIGAILDPIADKLLTGAAIVLLAHAHRMYAWVAALFIIRELGISGVRHLASQKNIEIKVSNLGKWKTFIINIALTCLMVNKSLFGWPWVEVGAICLWSSLAISMYSAWEYSLDFWKKAKFQT